MIKNPVSQFILPLICLLITFFPFIKFIDMYGPVYRPIEMNQSKFLYSKSS